MSLQADQIAQSFRDLQDAICRDLEQLDGTGTFREDAWDRPGGGGGRTRILEGSLVERGGVNFSAVHGELPEGGAKALGVTGGDFFATGVSIVLHPHNPHVPIIHMNVRYFELSDGPWWFGGGIDLTPHYVDPAAAARFHRGLRAVCDRHDPAYYERFKAWADTYFYLRHRKETRGVGGIFFDRLGEPGDRSALFSFVQDVGETFVPLYREQVEQRRDRTFGERERNWQRLRRGRYVEFNLVWDRGTKFGLETGGRTESILMSLPPLAGWHYDYQPEPESEEAQTLHWLRQKEVDWLQEG